MKPVPSAKSHNGVTLRQAALIAGAAYLLNPVSYAEFSMMSSRGGTALRFTCKRHMLELSCSMRSPPKREEIVTAIRRRTELGTYSTFKRIASPFIPSFLNGLDEHP